MAARTEEMSRSPAARLAARTPPHRSVKLGRLWERLQCPRSRGPVAIIPTLLGGGDVMEGVIYSVECAEVVGMIARFTPNFVSFEAPADLDEIIDDYARGVEPRSAPPEPVWISHDTDSPLLRFDGPWGRIENDWMVARARNEKSCLRFEAVAPFEILFIAHPHSGYCEITVDGAKWLEVDLFNPSTGVPRPVRYDQPIDAPVLIEVRPIARKNPESHNFQMVVEEVRISSSDVAEPVFDPVIRSRSGDFKPRAYQIMAELGPDAAMLDLGGGRRMLDDARYINLDIAPYGECDIVADAHRLPFKDGSFDFVYSVAVFEHLIEPQAAADEIWRILSDTGRMLVLTAFMQPVHSEGFHFYNATQWGADHWFRRFPHRVVGHGGALSQTVAWMARVSGAKQRMPAEDWRRLEELLLSMDPLISDERLAYVASYIRIEASKQPL